MKRIMTIAAVIAVLGMGSVARAAETKKPSVVQRIKAKVKKALKRYQVRTVTAVTAVRG